MLEHYETSYYYFVEFGNPGDKSAAVVDWTHISYFYGSIYKARVKNISKKF